MNLFQYSNSAYDMPSYSPSSPATREWSPIYPDDSAFSVGRAVVGLGAGGAQEVQGGLLSGPTIGTRSLPPLPRRSSLTSSSSDSEAGAITPFELDDTRMVAQGGDRIAGYGASHPTFALQLPKLTFFSSRLFLFSVVFGSTRLSACASLP